ncbi:uncharacterized protein LOC132310490 [Cornus florida]|uniref:uncharacterized protein LOC132310490 n=1 Tax=Cornus florida TaxID=4283 RepID=UPI0028A05B36|nr:uncharacterized protein LOC132310490 [Cornus florida]
MCLRLLLIHHIHQTKKMKQKMVIKLQINDQKRRSKALKIAVGISGVESAALQGADKNDIVVTGDEVDAVVLTTALRKGIVSRA